MAILTDFRRNVIIMFIAVACFGVPFWFLLDRDPPYTFEHVEISPPVVPQGGEIQITFTVKQHREPCSPGMIYREFKEESGKLHLFDPIVRATSPVIVENKFTRIAKLPDNISPGPTTYIGRACYSCNPLHTWLRWPVCATAPPATFNVIEKLHMGTHQ